MISLVNYIAVSVFGCILSAAFCGIGKEKKQKYLIMLTLLVTLAIEGIAYYFFGEEFELYSSVLSGLFPYSAYVGLMVYHRTCAK